MEKTFSYSLISQTNEKIYADAFTVKRGSTMQQEIRFAGYGPTLVRVALGSALIAHALLKIFVFTMPGTMAFFASQGFPGWTAYPVTAIEVAGGAALTLGWHARLAALIVLPGLLGALSVHAGNGWVFTSPKGGWEYPLFLVVSAAAVALQGAGACALGRNSADHREHR
jgi:putative oxidoreductase